MLCWDRSPGFGVTLTAETVDGSHLCAEACSHPHGAAEQHVSADDIGAKAAFNLLAEIYKVSVFYLSCGSPNMPSETHYSFNTFPICV